MNYLQKSAKELNGGGIKENKMSDLSDFKDLFNRVGIKVDIQEELDGRKYFELDIENSSKKVCGYRGFYSDLVFDKEGKFISFGIWRKLGIDFGPVL
jgi:hypothetical protein